MLMNPSFRTAGWLPALAGLVGLAWPATARADLHEYIKRAEPAYSWKLKEKKEVPQGTIYDLHLVSQTWQDIKWEHQLQVYQAKGTEPAKLQFLWNTGGSANPINIALGMELSQKIKAPVAFLYHVPNQPIFDKKEDALIAETFVRYLKTGDGSWPLLFPMAKSVVKAMDALQDFGKQEWKQPPEGFLVSGGSKRGWTSWLTGAADPRVKAIAPAVIDTLNMSEQFPHQLASFGAPSEMIRDYTKSGLATISPTEDMKKLWTIVDPYTYRDRLTLPKFLVNGNNDPYWSTDSLNLYWDGLKGDKWVMYVPNAGHNLIQKGQLRPTRAIDGLAAFARHQITNTPMPKLQWQHGDNGSKLQLTVQAEPAPRSARLWVAEAPTKDFRKAEWKEAEAKTNKRTVVGEVTPAAQGCLAFFGELEYEIDGLRYCLSTQIRIAGKPLPKKE
jgi:PhoPQ-activated pathogenicity-related protein